MVILCAGDTTVTGTIDDGSPVGPRVDPYSIDCSDSSPVTTRERVYEDAAPFAQVMFDSKGR